MWAHHAAPCARPVPRDVGERSSRNRLDGAARRRGVPSIGRGAGSRARRRRGMRRGTRTGRRSRRTGPATRRPRHSTRPASSAASGSAPVGSTTSFIRSHRKRIATSTSASVQVTTSRAFRRIQFERQFTERGRAGAVADRVGRSRSRAGPSGTTGRRRPRRRAPTPDHRARGAIVRARDRRSEQPSAPSAGASSRSSDPASSRSSAAAVPLPEQDVRWSNGGTSVMPRSSAIRAASASRPTPSRS